MANNILNCCDKLECLEKKVEQLADLINNIPGITGFVQLSLNGTILEVTYTDAGGNNSTATIDLSAIFPYHHWTPDIVANTCADLPATGHELFEMALVQNSTGTAWLPSSNGGTFCGAGLYYWNGSEWVNTDDEVFTALADIYNTLTQIQTDLTNLNNYVITNINSINATITNIQNDITTIQGNITSINNNIANIQTSIININNDIADLQACCSTVQANITTLQNDVSNLQACCTQVQNDINQLQIDVANINGQITVINTNITSIQNDISQLQTDLASLTTQVNQNTTDIANLQLCCTQVQNDITNIINDINNLTTQVNQNTNDITNLQTDVSNLQTDVTNLQNELANLTTQVDQNTNDITNLQTDVANLQTCCLQVQTDITNIQTTITNIQNDITNIQNDIANIWTTINNIEVRVANNEFAIIDLNNNKADKSFQIITPDSVQGGGDLGLSGNTSLTLNLVGDVQNPPAFQTYGTDGIGAKGWQTKIGRQAEIIIEPGDTELGYYYNPISKQQIIPPFDPATSNQRAVGLLIDSRGQQVYLEKVLVNIYKDCVNNGLYPFDTCDRNVELFIQWLPLGNVMPQNLPNVNFTNIINQNINIINIPPLPSDPTEYTFLVDISPNPQFSYNGYWLLNVWTKIDAYYEDGFFNQSRISLQFIFNA